MAIKIAQIRDMRQNKTDRPRNLLSIWQCLDCDFYDKQTQLLQPGQSYEVLKAGSSEKECPNPDCKSKNIAAVISEENGELPPLLSEKKQGKYRRILLEGRPCSDGNSCTCPLFKREMELKAASIGEKDWESTLPVQICPESDKEYHLDWTITERTYF